MDISDFSQQAENVAQFTKALSHPVRLTILRLLIEKGKCRCGCHPCECGSLIAKNTCTCGCNCSTLVKQLPLSQSTVSRHIKELKDAGLISINNRKGEYTLNHKKLAQELISLLNILELNNLNTMENLMKCNCNENCTCGDNCTCGPDCNCGPDCKCCN